MHPYYFDSVQFLVNNYLMVTKVIHFQRFQGSAFKYVKASFVLNRYIADRKSLSEGKSLNPWGIYVNF